jgi:prevent-host-death family protein
MGRPADSIQVAELAHDANAVLRRVRTSKRPLVITQHGRRTAVLLSVAAYEEAERERELLRLLARGEKEIAAGIGYDLETVLADADVMLVIKRQ